MLKKRRFLPTILLPAIVLSSCGGASMDPSSSLGMAAILDQANLFLSKEDCPAAVALLKPVYESKYTNNKIRMAMASAYGCDARINVFTLVASLISDPTVLVGSGLWQFAAKQFPSTPSDRVVEAGQLAQDAVQSVIEPSAPVLPANLSRSTSFNPAALSVIDRKPDANAYLFFVALAEIGGIESRYGSPGSGGKKTVQLPWVDTATHAPVDPSAPQAGAGKWYLAPVARINASGTAQQADGCAYASAIVNFVDSLEGLASSTTGSISSTFAGLQALYDLQIDAACALGCAECGGSVSCTACPSTLRDRTSCTGLATDVNTCAAKGIIEFINNHEFGWLGP